MRIPMLALCCALCAGCRDVPQPAGDRPATLATHPRAMDRIARLMREQFSAADPAVTERRIRCESARVERALGDDYQLRMRLLMDSLRTEYSAEQFRQLGQALAPLTFPTDGDRLCAAERADAEREAPLGNPASR